MKSRTEPLCRSIVFVTFVAFALGCVVVASPRPGLADKIHVAPPPPPPVDTRPAPTFDYKHEVKKVVRDRKPVVALLRPGDVVALKDWLPFGRGTAITDTAPDGTKSQTIISRGTEDKPVFMPSPFLVRELLRTGEFIVVERERIMEIARELALAKTPAVNPETTVRPGRLIGVHYIIEASFYPAGGLPADDESLIPVKREIQKRRLPIDPRAACVMFLTVYKVETGEIKAVATGADLQPAVAVQRAVEDLVDQLGDIVEPIRVSSVNPQTGMALLDIGADSGVKPGDQFAVGPAGPKGETAPATPAATSTETVKVQVIRADPLYSQVRITSGNTSALKDGQEAKPDKPPEQPAPAPAPAPPGK